MSNLKKIIVSLPESLLKQVDHLLKDDGKKNRSELVREALNLYLLEQKRKKIRQDLENGYREMGLLNSELSEEGLDADYADLIRYEEEYLMNSRQSNDKP